MITYLEVIVGTDQYILVDKMIEDLNGIVKKGVWTLVKLPDVFKSRETKRVYQKTLWSYGSM